MDIFCAWMSFHIRLNLTLYFVQCKRTVLPWQNESMNPLIMHEPFVLFNSALCTCMYYYNSSMQLFIVFTRFDKIIIIKVHCMRNNSVHYNLQWFNCDCDALTSLAYVEQWVLNHHTYQLSGASCSLLRNQVVSIFAGYQFSWLSLLSWSTDCAIILITHCIERIVVYELTYLLNCDFH